MIEILEKFNIKVRKVITVAIVFCLQIAMLTFPTAAKSVPFSLQILPIPQCEDHIDNDLDGLIDFPFDPDCSAPSDPQEGVAPVTSVSFTGITAPNSTVTILKDGVIDGTALSDSSGVFSYSISSIIPGSYIFSVYSTDTSSLNSSILSFPVNLIIGTSTSVSNIYLSPSLSSNNSQVYIGNPILLNGTGSPNSTVSLYQNNTLINTTSANSQGLFSFSVPTNSLTVGMYAFKVQQDNGSIISVTSNEINVFVVNAPVTVTPNPCGRADLNCDRRVNLVDFSIGAYWYKKPLSPAMIVIESQRLSNDGQVLLVDFSIMATFWTG